MIPNVNYEVVLCASRHETINPQGTQIEESIFPRTCPLNIKTLNSIAYDYLKKYVTNITNRGQLTDAILNVYITGFTPALVALLNIRTSRYKEVKLVLWHFDDKTQAYTPQVVL